MCDFLYVFRWCVCFFGWDLEGTGADARIATSAQHRFSKLRTILQVPLKLCPRKATLSTGPSGEVFQGSSIFPNLARDTLLAVMKPTLLQDTKVGLRNNEELSQDVLRPFL